MQNKDAIIKRISELPLSRNIIKDRIMRLNTNVQHQLKRDIRKCKYFSISLDETTDVTSHAQLAIIGRYSDGLTMREELIKLVSLSTSKSGSETCKVVIQTFRDLCIDISKVVSVTTDGAPNMEALCAKAGFTDLIGLLMYNNVRWLSRGKVLEHFVECFEEIKVFLDDKDLGNFPQLTLMFFTDLSVHINEPNLKLQGFGKSIDIMFGYIKAFESKVKIFKRDVETKTCKYFPRVTKYFEKASAAVQNEMELLHMKYQHVLDSLLDQFRDRFSQFRSLEQTMKIIKYPDFGIKWFPMDEIDDLEMQLAEFQDSIWAQVYVDLRSKLENLERCHLENQEECHYDQEIWSAWNRLPDTFSTLKNIAMALSQFFPLHTFALFSALNNIKTNKRNRLTDEVSNTCLGLKCTKYQPSIEDLANEIQQQRRGGGGRRTVGLDPPSAPQLPRAGPRHRKASNGSCPADTRGTGKPRKVAAQPPRAARDSVFSPSGSEDGLAKAQDLQSKPGMVQESPLPKPRPPANQGEYANYPTKMAAGAERGAAGPAERGGGRRSAAERGAAGAERGAAGAERGMAGAERGQSAAGTIERHGSAATEGGYPAVERRRGRPLRLSTAGPSKVGELGACLLRHQRTGTQIHREKRKRNSITIDLPVMPITPPEENCSSYSPAAGFSLKQLESQ
ncbi:LOW QUALITY PROTEIN: hypothetical protein QTO34_008362 [Cnephaeus nilssonii]|uniref:DUF4371 domain-containing protein n=1 Tax=Cnephaeus nilssonii TaxID=3371016 RepID=A0AA40IB86_CNENI|nr:LOW QUALITY PROTEIN: hypothetical protein QTO34_008362 [Eptesicus nilssonii]